MSNLPYLRLAWPGINLQDPGCVPPVIYDIMKAANLRRVKLWEPRFQQMLADLNNHNGIPVHCGLNQACLCSPAMPLRQWEHPLFHCARAEAAGWPSIIYELDATVTLIVALDCLYCAWKGGPCPAAGTQLARPTFPGKVRQVVRNFTDAQRAWRLANPLAPAAVQPAPLAAGNMPSGPSQEMDVELDDTFFDAEPSSDLPDPYDATPDPYDATPDPYDATPDPDSGSVPSPEPSPEPSPASPDPGPVMVDAGTDASDLPAPARVAELPAWSPTAGGAVMERLRLWALETGEWWSPALDALVDAHGDIRRERLRRRAAYVELMERLAEASFLHRVAEADLRRAWAESAPPLWTGTKTLYPVFLQSQTRAVIQPLECLHPWFQSPVAMAMGLQWYDLAQADFPGLRVACRQRTCLHDRVCLPAAAYQAPHIVCPLAQAAKRDTVIVLFYSSTGEVDSCYHCRVEGNECPLLGQELLSRLPLFRAKMEQTETYPRLLHRRAARLWGGSGPHADAARVLIDADVKALKEERRLVADAEARLAREMDDELNVRGVERVLGF